MITISLLFQKGVYPHNYMDDSERFNEILFSMDDITDTDYVHTKKVCKDFEIKYLGEYHVFYIQSNTFLLADVFENFNNMCVKI